MEVNIKYKDYSQEIDKATLKIDDLQQMELHVIEEITPLEEQISYIQLIYKGSGNNTSISYKLTKEELGKYIELLKLLGKQI